MSDSSHSKSTENCRMTANRPKEQKMAEKCGAKTKRGTDCLAAAVKGTSLCGLHGDPKRAAELGRMGGLRNRHYVDPEPVIINPPKTPEDVTNVLCRVMVDLRAKKMDPKIAHTLTYMTRVLIEAFAATNMQKELESLRQQLQTKAEKP
jgi:hypothetical protein